MARWRTGTVSTLLSERQGLQRVEVDGEPAYALTDLVGRVGVGDEVVVNTTAVDLGLGTGGWHPIHVNLSLLEADCELQADPDSGSGSVFEPSEATISPRRVRPRRAGEHDPVAEQADLAGLAGLPVVVGTLHSQLACVVATLHHRQPMARIAYVMTDGAALPLRLSDLVASLVERNLLAGTVTIGPAFGGDHDAMSVAHALVIARDEIRADAIVVTMGPGVVGTGTELGTTAVEAVHVLDTVAAMGGRPILALRASAADARARHRGVSHHTSTVLALARPGVLVATVDGIDIDRDGEGAGHEIIRVAASDLAVLFAEAGLDVTTMGRGVADDPLYFAVAGAAGVLAARYVEG